MLEKQLTGIWKGLCFLLRPASVPLRGADLPCRKEEQGPGSRRGSGIAKCSQHRDRWPCGFLLAASLHISSITAASKCLLYLCTSAVWKALPFMLSFSPNTKNQALWLSSLPSFYLKIYEIHNCGQLELKTRLIFIMCVSVVQLESPITKAPVKSKRPVKVDWECHLS